MPPFSLLPAFLPSRCSCSHGCGFSGFQKNKSLANIAKVVVRIQEGEGEKMFAAQTQVQWVIIKCVFLKSCCETFKLQVGLF